METVGLRAQLQEQLSFSMGLKLALDSYSWKRVARNISTRMLRWLYKFILGASKKMHTSNNDVFWGDFSDKMQKKFQKCCNVILYNVPNEFEKAQVSEADTK